ncbi:rhomboid family intramembrane serine protease GlpG [Photobacterium sp. 1_MG-2023]|uniref:rhomboid family intramembrane serine protease GlpG n=1 Tax=Photobacterium sp. 1_MG-2023 TaxID=3062646 RepID=UPI0026E1E023|nr:rhomboid family intramembrane serine protease GlpG [Photobacterium sp. 1_MG-2023]MDO6708502.1 rhomboid family intramembrane serine protease GlpG [Photobacterium sp. 1_MG-2023]
MLRIVVLDNPRMAQAFIDYMASRGIELMLAPEPGGQYAIWLTDPQHQVEIEAEWQRFSDHPEDPKYLAASWQMVSRHPQPKFNYHSPSLLAQIRAQAGPVCLTVLGVTLVIYCLWLLGWQRPLFQALHFPLMQGDGWQLWRYVSHSLLHFSILHLVFNCLWWWILGGRLEKHSGSLKLLEVFLLSALISGLAQYWVNGPNFGGLSGVVYALMGYLWWLGWLAPSRGLSLPNGIVVLMLIWLILGFTNIMGIQVANMAHLFGLITGCVLGFVDARLRHPANS